MIEESGRDSSDGTCCEVMSVSRCQRGLYDLDSQQRASDWALVSLQSNGASAGTDCPNFSTFTHSNTYINASKHTQCYQIDTFPFIICNYSVSITIVFCKVLISNRQSIRYLISEVQWGQSRGMS